MSTVFDVPDLVLHEHGRFLTAAHHYEVLGLDGTPLAVVEEQSTLGFLGVLASSRYVVSAGGQVLLLVDRPGSWGRLEFHAARPDGSVLGRVRQENSWGSPRLEVATPEGFSARVTGGSWGSRDWTVTLLDDPGPTALRAPGDTLATLHRRHRTLGRALVDADEFHLSTDPALAPDLRALLLVAVVALDGVRDARKSSGD